jgi:uncharacterized protein (DUF433 family)
MSVEHVHGLLKNGWSEADILESYPHLEVEDLRVCLTYVLEADR